MIENGILYIVGLEISISEFLWTLISFFPFLFLLKKLLYDPILNVMDKRRASVEAGLAEGREAQRKLEEGRKQLDAELLESGNAARELIGTVRSAANKEKSQVLAQAHTEAAELHGEVRRRVQNEEAEARADIEKNMPELVKLLSGALLGSDETADDALVNDCIRQVNNN